MNTTPSWLLIGAVTLILTFGLYTQTDVVIMLSEQLWSCF